MTIVFEGAPATGKSTIARFLAEHYGYVRIPEVNELFPDRPSPEPEHWYCQRQLDRCRMAAEQHGSVLDGDPLQAVWFNWIHPERGHLRWADALDFFRQRAHCLLVPAGYVHLHIDEATRYKREQVRETIRGHSADQFRDKWARYAQFTAPQTALFSAMQHTYPNWVVSIQAAEIESTVDKILNLQWADPPAAADLMDWLQYWLNHHHAAEFQ